MVEIGEQSKPNDYAIISWKNEFSKLLLTSRIAQIISQQQTNPSLNKEQIYEQFLDLIRQLFQSQFEPNNKQINLVVFAKANLTEFVLIENIDDLRSSLNITRNFCIMESLNELRTCVLSLQERSRIHFEVKAKHLIMQEANSDSDESLEFISENEKSKQANSTKEKAVDMNQSSFQAKNNNEPSSPPANPQISNSEQQFVPQNAANFQQQSPQNNYQQNIQPAMQNLSVAPQATSPNVTNMSQPKPPTNHQFNQQQNVNMPPSFDEIQKQSSAGQSQEHPQQQMMMNQFDPSFNQQQISSSQNKTQNLGQQNQLPQQPMFNNQPQNFNNQMQMPPTQEMLFQQQNNMQQPQMQQMQKQNSFENQSVSNPPLPHPGQFLPPPSANDVQMFNTPLTQNQQPNQMFGLPQQMQPQQGMNNFFQ